MPAFFGVQAKRVGKSPLFDVLKRCAFRIAEENSILPELRIVNVTLLRGDIEIAAQQNN